MPGSGADGPGAHHGVPSYSQRGKAPLTHDVSDVVPIVCLDFALAVGEQGA